MGLSSAGVGSGLDVKTIVSSLMAAEQKPLNSLNSQKSQYSTKLSSFGSFKNNLAQYQTTLQTLSDSKSFQSLTASTSDSTAFSGKLSGNPTPANYNIEVNQLAQSQKIVSSGINDINAIVGTGTISFDFGSIQGGSINNGSYTGATFTSNAAPSKIVTIDSSNNTLSGIRDAINSAGIGVTAAIINDGSNSPFRLALTNNQTGQTQSMRMAVAGATGLANLLNYDPANNSGQALTELNKAQNALIKIDGIPITKTSNTIDDAITGVTLSLQKTNTGNPTSLNIARNTNSLTTNLQNLVKGYNDLAGSITSLTAYDSATNIGAALYGENSLRSIKNQIRSTLASALPNTTGFSMLSQVGISFQKDGTLALDSNKLQTAIDSSYDKISSLFTATGKSSDSQINYTSATPATKTGSYAVAISQLATQGSVNGSTVAGLSISAGSNDSLQVSLDGVTSTLTLTAGTYANVAELVTEIQAKINGNSSFKNAGSSVLVSSNSDGSIKLISNSFGAKSSISLAGNAASTILGGNGVAQTGVNLIGSINGKTLASSGQYLIGATGDDSDGLTIKILGGSTGNRGVVTYTQGFAFKLNQLIDSYSAADGLITTRTDGISKSINRVNDNITKTQYRLKLLQAHYETIFNSLDTTMSKISSTSNYLTAQLASMNKSNNN